jgi:4-amino-4-deoxy-L-arabinose transferase-like glycosyltransferase
VVMTRLRRSDERTGWLLIVGGAAATTAVVFSFASGIFHPYYVSLLAPFAAALIGAGASSRLAPLAIAGGAVTELVVLAQTGQSWAVPLVVMICAGCAVALAFVAGRRTRLALVGLALAALFAAPVAYAAQTLGHAENGTFPAGGPASTMRGAGRGGFGGGPSGGFGGGFAGPGAGGMSPGPPPAVSGARTAAAGAPSAIGAGQGNDSTLTAALKYAASHGGGMIGVSSQSSAATAILTSNANVAGLGGFSGRESSVTASWLAGEIRSGRLRWVLVDSAQRFGLAGDTRTGSQSAMKIAAKVCKKVSNVNLYDCQGKAAQVSAQATEN